MTWSAYPAYRDSGSSWIESIPETWRTAQLKTVAARITDGAHVSPETEGGVYDFVSTRDVGERGIDFDGSLKTTPASYDYLVRNGCRPCRGDVLFSKDGTIGRTTVVATDHPFVVASSLIIIKPNRREVVPEFVHYLCQSKFVLAQVDSYVRGAGLPRLSITNLRRIIGAFPPVEEQRHVVRFLRREVAKIDALIGKQEQLIATLREDRTATVTHAVTKGLDPDVEMTESGVEWLGVTPAHWSSTKLAWNSSCRSGEAAATGSVEELADEENGTVPVIGGNGVMGYTNAANLFDEAIVIGRVGALCGNVHLVDGPAWVTDNALLLKLHGNAFDRTYLWYLLTVRRLNDLAAKTAQPLITGGQVSSLRLPLPPSDEQTDIVAYLTERCTTVDALIAKATEVIGTLREYRSALITDAVTGKIDVRGAA
jgi:type I restriction enzyme S subunit